MDAVTQVQICVHVHYICIYTHMHIHTHIYFIILMEIMKAFLSYALEIKNLKCVNLKLINLKQCITSKQDRRCMLSN